MKFLHDVIYKGSLTAEGNVQLGDSRLDTHNVYGALVVGNGSTGTDITALTVKAMGTGASINFQALDVYNAPILATVENGYILAGGTFRPTDAKTGFVFDAFGVSPLAFNVVARSNNTGSIYKGLVVTEGNLNGLSGGNFDTRYIEVAPLFNATGGSEYKVRGFYYNPTLTNLSATSVVHTAWENTSGDIIHGNLSGTGSRMVVADSAGKLGTQAIPNSVTISNNDAYRVITGGSGNNLAAQSTLMYYDNIGALYVEGNASFGYGGGIEFVNTAVNGTQWGFYAGSTSDTGFMMYRYLPTQVELAYWNTDRYSVRNDVKIGWSSTNISFNAMDTALAREAAGLVQINNGSLNTYASLKLLNLTATGLAGSGTRMVTVDANGLLGSQTIPSGGTGSSTLTGLTDVNITSVANNQLLKYDSGSSKWINWTPNYLTSYTETYQGTVTSVSVVSANGFSGTVATDTTTPAITLSTTVTGILKGNGTSISAATAGTDYEVPLTFAQGLTRASNTVKWGGSVSEDITLTEGTNLYTLSGLGFKRVRWNAGSTTASYATLNANYNNGAPYAELWAGDSVLNRTANVFAYHNGGNPYISLATSGGVTSNYQAGVQIGESGFLFFGHPTGVYTERFQIDNGGTIYIKTAPVSTTTGTQFLTRDTSSGQVLYRVFDPTSYLTTADASTTYQPLDADLTAIAALSGTSGLLKKTAANTWSLDTSTYLTGNQTITLSGAITGSGTTGISTTLANSVVGISNLSATGTASSSTFLRGDNTWATFGVTDTNIYNTNGTLTGDRTISGNTYQMFFNDLNLFSVSTPNPGTGIGSFFVNTIGARLRVASDASLTVNNYVWATSSDIEMYSHINSGASYHKVNVTYNGVTIIGNNTSTNLMVKDLPSSATSNVLYYDSTTGKVTYGATPGGSSDYSVTTQTANYTETATSGTKIIKGNTTGGTFTITLPTAVGNTAIIIIKKTAGTVDLIVDAAGSETIDGGLTATLVKVNESIMLISDNANWQIV